MLLDEAPSLSKPQHFREPVRAETAEAREREAARFA